MSNGKRILETHPNCDSKRAKTGGIDEESASDDCEIIQIISPRNGNQDESGSTSGQDNDCDEDDDAQFDDQHSSTVKVHPFLLGDIKTANRCFSEPERELGIEAAVSTESRSYPNFCCTVTLNLPVACIPERLRELWEIEITHIAICFDRVDKERFRTVKDVPVVSICRGTDRPSRFMVGEQLKNMAIDMLRSRWSVTEESAMNPNSRRGSFFAFLYLELIGRLKQLSEYCMVCNGKLFLGGYLPSVCDRDLCVYQYHELGLLDDVSLPRVPPDVLQLLLLTFFAANLSQRRDSILTPAPALRDAAALHKETFDLSVYHLKHPVAASRTLFTRPDENQADEVSILNRVALYLGCTRKILASAAEYRKFRNKFPQSARLIEWLSVTNRAYIQAVPANLHLGFACTPHQFIFVADSPAKQTVFDNLKANNQGRSRFLFHGSPIDNWHSIIRNGLKVLSNTKHQLHGAVYGNGVYLSPDLNMSYAYARGQHSKQQQVTPGAGQDCLMECCRGKAILPTQTLSIVALVEVVDDPSVLRCVDAAQKIYVLNDDNYCSIRLLLLYTRFSPNSLTCSMLAGNDGKAEIETLLDLFRNADPEARVNHAGQ